MAQSHRNCSSQKRDVSYKMKNMQKTSDFDSAEAPRYSNVHTLSWNEHKKLLLLGSHSTHVTRSNKRVTGSRQQYCPPLSIKDGNQEQQVKFGYSLQYSKNIKLIFHSYVNFVYPIVRNVYKTLLTTLYSHVNRKVRNFQ